MVMAFSYEPDWGNLPAPALFLILEKLSEPIDRVWFSNACKQWYSVAKDYREIHLSSQILPMLMTPTPRERAIKWSLYSIATKKLYNLPVPSYRRFCGSSHGWLVTVDPTAVITLINPFNDVAPIRLPPITSSMSNVWDMECVVKVILSADPKKNPNDYVTVAIFNTSCHLAFIKSGQKSWNCILIPGFSDMVFYNGLVYAVGLSGKIVSLNVNATGQERSLKLVSQENGPWEDCKAYLVKSLEGDLWMVRRFLHGTRNFKVDKLKLDDQSGSLVQKLEIECLGDNVLFVGNNDSMSFSATSFGCLHKDSIYFADDFAPPYLIYSTGIFDAKNRSFCRHYSLDPLLRGMPPALWILPSIQ